MSAEIIMPVFQRRTYRMGVPGPWRKLPLGETKKTYRDWSLSRILATKALRPAKVEVATVISSDNPNLLTITEKDTFPTGWRTESHSDDTQTLAKGEETVRSVTVNAPKRRVEYRDSGKRTMKKTAASYRTNLFGLPLNLRRRFLYPGQSVEFDGHFTSRVSTVVSLSEADSKLTVASSFETKPKTAPKYDLNEKKKVRVRAGLVTRVFRGYNPLDRLNA